MITETEKTLGGFAAMDAEKNRDIARMGGQTAQSEKRGVSQNPFLATEAGGKGGRSVAPENRNFKMGQKIGPALTKNAGAKGGRTAAHGHSRHK